MHGGFGLDQGSESTQSRKDAKGAMFLSGRALATGQAFLDKNLSALCVFAFLR